MPDQRTVPGDGSLAVRLMSVFSAERVQIILVCVDPVSQDLDCPEALRTEIRAVDPGGTRIGDLTA